MPEMDVFFFSNCPTLHSEPKNTFAAAGLSFFHGEIESTRRSVGALWGDAFHLGGLLGLRVCGSKVRADKNWINLSISQNAWTVQSDASTLMAMIIY